MTQQIGTKMIKTPANLILLVLCLTTAGQSRSEGGTTCHKNWSLKNWTNWFFDSPSDCASHNNFPSIMAADRYIHTKQPDHEFRSSVYTEISKDNLATNGQSIRGELISISSKEYLNTDDSSEKIETVDGFYSKRDTTD